MPVVTVSSETAPEAPLVLDLQPPQPLTLADQFALWFNLGVSLTGPVTALFVLSPFFDGTRMSLLAALVATVLGAVLGSGLLAAAAIPGAVTGAPSMVLLRGLFGRRGSYLPTTMNIAQNIGWGTIEVIVIASAASALTSDGLRPLWVILAGLGATAMAIKPLGSVRTLRKIVIWLVLAASIYLFVQLLRGPLPSLTGGGANGWQGFGLAVDTVIAVCVSYAPLVNDYSRHSRSPKAAFVGTWGGYALAASIYIGLGLLAFSTTVGLDEDVIAGLLAVPAGAIAVLVLAVDEVDEAFANVYSTTMSLQNIWPELDRRLLAAGVGAVATALALMIDLQGYQSFLYLIGSVFVPLVAVMLVDWFLVSRGRWDLGEDAPLRTSMLASWAVGFAAYQLVNPGTVAGWSDAWIWVGEQLRINPPTWLAASWFSFVVAAGCTLLLGRIVRQRTESAAHQRLTTGR